jgi:hypothetical protein
MKPHILSGGCWCQPVDISGGGDPEWDHNSVDRREHTTEKGVWQ